MGATVPLTLLNPSINPVDCSCDPLAEFGKEFCALLDRWRDRTGGYWRQNMVRSFVDDEPIRGQDDLLYPRLHHGPQVKIVLTLTDMTRADEFALARYPDGSLIDPPSIGSRSAGTVADEA
jgi:hypothetical protein